MSTAIETDDSPEQMIVIDYDCKAAPFFLRLRQGQDIRFVELANAHGSVQSLPAAVRAADLAGYAPTHYVEVGRRPQAIQKSIVRHPAGTAARS